jgi:Fe2+ or Zn2+ uptake regulation protein
MKKTTPFPKCSQRRASVDTVFKCLDTLEKHQIIHEIKATEQFEKIFSALENKSSTYTQGILFDHTTYFEIESIIY